MSDNRQFLIKTFTSLQLTVVLLALSIVLVFVGTIDQVHLGIWAVQEKYFRTFFVWWQMPDSQIAIPVFPGGYLVGGLLMINLVAGHLYRFRFSWKKFGLTLSHSGLILLLVGELLSGLWQEEFQLQLTKGETKNYSESFHNNELAITDTSSKEFDQVVAIPDSFLVPKRTIQTPNLPFRITVKSFHPNAQMLMRRDAPNAPAVEATLGFGAQLVLNPLPITYKQDERNSPAALLEISGEKGVLGTLLVSTQLAMPQTLSIAGRDFTISYRIAREYKPFTLTLLELHHDVYPGSDIPRNFSSRVRLRSDDGKDDREVVIFMNNPLRYGGLTFYQYQMNEASNFSAFQVVRNPSWIIPYVACIMLSLGLSVHFCITLAGFLSKRKA